MPSGWGESHKKAIRERWQTLAEENGYENEKELLIGLDKKYKSLRLAGAHIGYSGRCISIRRRQLGLKNRGPGGANHIKKEKS